MHNLVQRLHARSKRGGRKEPGETIATLQHDRDIISPRPLVDLARYREQRVLFTRTDCVRCAKIRCNLIARVKHTYYATNVESMAFLQYY
jgi:hypothetical protein